MSKRQKNENSVKLAKVEAPLRGWSFLSHFYRIFIFKNIIFVIIITEFFRAVTTLGFVILKIQQSFTFCPDYPIKSFHLATSWQTYINFTVLKLLLPWQFLLFVSSYHVTYMFQSESTLYSFLNVKELLTQNRRDI